MHRLAEHRADARHLDHHPLDDIVALAGVLGQELAGLFGEVEQDRPELDHGVGLPARTVMIDDRWNLGVRIDLQELRAELLALPDVDELGVIGQARLLRA